MSTNDPTTWLARALAALDLSTAHWERLASGTQAPDEAPYGRDCALCQEFYSEDEIDDDGDSAPCRQCPIFRKTRKSECRGTPYYIIIHLWSRDKPAFREAAVDMVNYLKDLRKELSQ